MSTRRRSHRSIVVRLTVFLLLGAVVNVAVAWGCAIWSPVSLEHELSTTHFMRIDAVPDEFEPIVKEHWFRGKSMMGYFLVLHDREVTGWSSQRLEVWWLVPGANYMTPHHSAYIMEAGWPCKSIRCDGFADTSFVAGVRGYQSHWRCGLDPPEFLGAWNMGILGDEIFPRPIPYDVIPLGFVLDTLLFAAILWPLFAAPGRVQRWRRIRRGLCAKCAYPVGTSDVCTECGAAIRPSGAAECSHVYESTLRVK